MTYLILKKASCPLYLADRNKTKKYWWTYKLSLAMEFIIRDVAQQKADSLNHGIFRVITKDEAVAIRNKADYIHESKVERLDEINNQDPGDSEYWNNKDY